MIIYLLLVLTYETGRLENIPFHSEGSCMTAAKSLGAGLPRNFGFITCVKDEVPNAEKNSD